VANNSANSRRELDSIGEIFCFQDDEDGHLVVLTIIEELMSKRQEEFLDHFARLGVFSKVQSLMGSGGEVESDVIKSQEDASTSRAVKGKRR
jgi:E3 ubiquitin-protein ligase HECTD1